MGFEGPNNVPKKSLGEKIKGAARVGAAAVGIGASAIGLGHVAKDKYWTDYSHLPTKKEALKKAKEDNKDGFYYKDKYYDIKSLEDRIKKNIEPE